MISKKGDSKHKEFKGVNFEVLATGDKSMVTKMNYKIGDNVPFHTHPNEQCGYIISGEYFVQYGQIREKLTSGDSYCIPENMEHSWEVITGGEVIDVFTPPRLDYL
ncbi:MAG: cupin domain-containing protein [Salinivirgaceae bacterium]|jgi:quercetin dioxygenase-like cupin family protein